LLRKPRNWRRFARVLDGMSIAMGAQRAASRHFSWSLMMFGEQILHRAGRNPFYLLSALSMLLGCFALSRHPTFVPGQWMPLVILMGVLQVYEFLLLVLAAVKLVLLRDALALTSRRALAVAPLLPRSGDDRPRRARLPPPLASRRPVTLSSDRCLERRRDRGSCCASRSTEGHFSWRSPPSSRSS
jgi:hypothetical protein